MDPKHEKRGGQPAAGKGGRARKGGRTQSHPRGSVGARLPECTWPSRAPLPRQHCATHVNMQRSQRRLGSLAGAAKRILRERLKTRQGRQSRGGKGRRQRTRDTAGGRTAVLWESFRAQCTLMKHFNFVLVSQQVLW